MVTIGVYAYFDSCIAYKFIPTNSDKKGINNNGKYLKILHFADEIIHISDNLGEIKEMMNDLKNSCEEISLKINIGKSWRWN